MKCKRNITPLLLLVCLLISGCGMRTVDRMYAVPKRSHEFRELQLAIDQAMVGLDYSAPISGENRQSVQMADLDGDGKDEYLLFAVGNSDDPLKILIFKGDGDRFLLYQTLESQGTRFETVEYVDMDDSPGKELVVGVQVSDQILRHMSVFSFAQSQPCQIMATNYSKFVAADLDMDERTDLVVMGPGESAEDYAAVTLYRWREGAVSRSRAVWLSGSLEQIRRIMVSPLHGGVNAVYVASSVEEGSIITDVFAMAGNQFTNISASSESGTSTKTLRNHFVYADDIDDDGILEIPNLIDMRSVHNLPQPSNRYLIRWYAMTVDGEEVDKMYTFHNFETGWYLTLNAEWASRISVVPEGDVHTFYVWNRKLDRADKILSIQAFSGPDRDLEARLDDRIELYKTDSVIYTGKLEVSALSYGLSQENIINSFHLIHRDWITGET